MEAMRQRTLLRWMAGALSALILGQLAAAWAARTPETVTAVRYEGEPPVYVTGVVIRQERAVYAPRAGDWAPALPDGGEAGAGQTLLAWAPSAELAGKARQVRLLRAAEAAYAQPAIARRGEIHAAVAALNAASGEDRQSAAEALTGLLLGEGEDPAPGLQAAEEALLRQSGGASTVAASEAGLFAAVCDGLEERLTPEEPWEPLALPLSEPEELALGRLITGDVWYYRTELPFRAPPGEKLTAVLLGGIEQTATLTVEQVRARRTGCLALLSCKEALAQVASVRQLDVKILIPGETGVEIPRESVYTEDGRSGVRCLVGGTAVFKPVTVVKDLGDTLVAELDQTTTAGLWPGDQVYRNP